MKLLSIAGARPNFMKLAAIANAVDRYNKKTTSSLQEDKSLEPLINHVIVHTGQHYDKNMSQTFFYELGLPEPDINLEVGSGSHARQTAEIIVRIEAVLLMEQPDVLLVVGDVNSTIACALVASKIEYPPEHTLKRPMIVHVEAGLRSFDRGMPEEINRILTDALSDVLFVTEASAEQNLIKEGVPPEKIHFVGNVMIDTLIKHLGKASRSLIKQSLRLPPIYCVLTLHRPSNVDDPEKLSLLLSIIESISQNILIVFPVHPRTNNKLKKFGLWDRLASYKNIILQPPLGYLDFLNLIMDAEIVITDSGGIQEETTYLGIPCVTLRNNTERPVTITEGSNYLVGTNKKKIIKIVEEILSNKKKRASVPLFWDEQAGDRIIPILVDSLSKFRDP